MQLANINCTIISLIKQHRLTYFPLFSSGFLCPLEIYSVQELSFQLLSFCYQKIKIFPGQRLYTIIVSIFSPCQVSKLEQQPYSTCYILFFLINIELTILTSITDPFMQGEDIHGVPGLVNLFGIESPGLTSSMAIAEHIVARYLR